MAVCVAETAARLVSTAGAGDDVTHRRALGSALRGAEAAALTRLPENLKRRGTQGIEFTLGFYDEPDLQLVVANHDLVATELSATLGGFSNAVQLKCSHLSDDPRWLGTGVEWPKDAAPPRHLHRYVLNCRDHPGPARRPDHIDEPAWLIIARRLRFRIGIDHANGRRDAFWWTTAHTAGWIERARTSSDPRETNYFVIGVLNNSLSLGVSADPAVNDPDDWGCVRLAEDPLRVLKIGPKSRTAETHADVSSTLAVAGAQLATTAHHLPETEDSSPLLTYAAELRTLARRPNLLHDVDVVIVYRGGGLREATRAGGQKTGLIDANSRTQLVAAVNALAELGVEVVIGFGHGTTAVYSHEDVMPVGVFEVVTPTAAANWVIREHVNNRLAFSLPDPGQPKG